MGYMNWRYGEIKVGDRVRCLKIKPRGFNFVVGRVYQISGFNLSKSAWIKDENGNHIDNLHGDWELVPHEWDI